ncbi:hypothetical protein NQ314_020369 [Rhamnusium bicolor]|uniref:Uncharacterized protein n=1 Tax=Rhamnusium bicolor TaxID=1586634 RepID=A0AAV8WLC9_9CUCU|nr:hypothetical protein NQ314_020369 [Rhamnusium bicolor]
MKFQEILLISSALFVSINAENKDNKHEHHLHEKSYQSKPQEKSHNRYHILNRHKQSETENQRNHHFQKLVYRDGNQNYSNDANGKPAPNSLGLQIDYNAIAGLIGVVNKSSNIALIFDSHNVAAILNGQSGVITIVDIHSSMIYRISNAQENGISLKSGFDVYFQNLSSLQDLLNIGQQCQQKYNFSNISPSVLNEMSSDLGSLGGLNSLDGLKQTSLFTSELKGSLAFLYKGKGTFKIFKSLQWFVGLNFAFAKLFDNTRESLQSEKLDLGPVFGASSVIEALLNFLSQIAKYEDLSKLLRRDLSSPEKWLNVIADASKASNDGVDGLITVLSNIIDVFRGKGSVSTVINSLINYNPHSDGNSFNLSQIINQALDIIQRQNELFNNFSAFEVIFNILKDLNNNNFIWNSVNIRDVIKLLEFENPREVIQTIVKIISQGIPHIIDYLKNIPVYGNIVQTVLREANFSQIFTNDFNPTSFLSKLPVIGNVLRQIFTSLVNSNPISQGFNNILGSNLTHGVFGNIGGSIINGTSEIGSGIEHGISSFLGTITSGFFRSRLRYVI